MILPDEYRTGNKGMDRLILKTLEKENQVMPNPVTQSLIAGIQAARTRQTKFRVAPKEDRTSHDNIVFDSRQEMIRYDELLLLQRAGIIEGLELQKRFVLVEDFVYHGEKYRGVSYYADFYYVENGKEIVEEWKVKATKTKDYIIKKKLFLTRFMAINFKEMVSDAK